MAFTISLRNSTTKDRIGDPLSIAGQPLVFKEIDDTDYQQLQNNGWSTGEVRKTDLSFPTDDDLKRVEQCEKYEKIFKGEFFGTSTQKAVFSLRDYFFKDPKTQEILKVCFNAPKALITKTMRFFAGGRMSFRAESEKASEGQLEQIQVQLNDIVKSNNIKAFLQETCLSFQCYGFATGYVWLDVDNGESEAVIEEVQYNENYPTLGVRKNKIKDWSIAKYLELEIEEKGKMKKIVAIYRQRYFLIPIFEFAKENGEIVFVDGLPEVKQVGKKLFIEHSLHKTKNTYKTNFKEPLSMALLGSDYARFDFSPIEETELDFIPIKQINNLKLGSQDFGNSIIEDIMSLTEELQDSLTRLVTEFIKHLTSKIAVPASSAIIDTDERTGKPVIDYKKLEVFLIDNGDQIPQYITKDTAMMKEAFNEIETILSYMAVMTESPKSFLGIDSGGGAEKVEALKIRRMEFLKKIEDYQEIFRDFMQTLLLWALQLQSDFELPEDLTIDINFRQGLPRDAESEARTHEIALNSGIESKETAISAWQQIEGSELEAEVARIKLEEKESADKFSFNTFDNQNE